MDAVELLVDARLDFRTGGGADADAPVPSRDDVDVNLVAIFPEDCDVTIVDDGRPDLLATFPVGASPPELALLPPLAITFLY